MTLFLGFQVFKISFLGHRKRILASLGDRLHEDPPQKPPRSITLREPSGNHTPPQLSPSLSQSTYTTGGSLDVPHMIMQGDARRRRNDSYFDDIPRSKLERQMAQQSSVCEIWTNQNAGYPYSAIHQVHNVRYFGHWLRGCCVAVQCVALVSLTLYAGDMLLRLQSNV
ncbi:hypothetical protein lerEdw1_003907 [Lerista edwardsae]|nr:hypothetical protein lerEdw1_003907 [Lerista edwardsae]